MTNTKLEMAALPRTLSGKGVSRALRRELQVPGVIYGDGKPPVMISLDDKTINLTYLKGHMYTTICALDVAGTKHNVIAKDIQLDPVTDRIVHVDFLRVSPKTTLRIMVPVHVTNRETSIGIKAGGVLVYAQHEIELLCPANDIPESVTVDLATIEIGDAVKMSEIPLPKGVKLTAQNKEVTILSIHAPTVKADADAEADAATAAAAAAVSSAAAEAAKAGTPAKADAKPAAAKK